MTKLKHFVWIISPISLSVLLVGCIAENPYTIHRAACKTIKNDLVFKPTTTDTRRLNLDYAEEPLQYHSYEANYCEEVM